MKKTVIQSQDSLHHAYCLSKDFGRMTMLIHDGLEVTRSLNISNLVFSPDASRLAAFANREDGWSLILDGKPTPCYQPIGLPRFSPDSKQVVYWSRDGRRFFLVVDGQMQRMYDAVLRDSLTFAHDSDQHGYLARMGDRWYIVAGDSEHPVQGDPVGALVFDTQAQRFVLRDAPAESKTTAVADASAP